MEYFIKEVHIKNFKCFNDFAIKNLNRINIFYGGNDSGKTTLLEAIYIAFSNVSPNNIFHLLRNFPFTFPVSSIEDSWDLLFFKLDNKKSIELKVVFENTDSLNVKLSKPFLHKDEEVKTSELRQLINRNSLFISWIYYQKFVETIININQEIQKPQENISFISSLPFAPNIFISSHGDLKFPIKSIFFFTSSGMPIIRDLVYIYGEIVRENSKHYLLDSIRSVKPEVEEIDIINFAGITSVGIKFKNDNNYYPINAVGEGFLKMFMLISLLIKNMDGIILIDEIENGLYWKAQPVFWEVIEELAIKFNVQLFITTHSYEFLDNVVKSTNNLKNISGFPMIRNEETGVIEYSEHNGELLKEAIESNIEIR